MSPTISFDGSPMRPAPRTRLVMPNQCLLQRMAAAGVRLAIACSMIGLAYAQPRLLPLFALAVPFWIAAELEGLQRIARG